MSLVDRSSDSPLVEMDDLIMAEPAAKARYEGPTRRTRKRRTVAKRQAFVRRIHRGFHRIGIVFGSILCVLIFFAAFMANEEIYLQVIASGVGLGIAFYALMRSVGWIVLGFLE